MSPAIYVHTSLPGVIRGAINSNGAAEGKGELGMGLMGCGVGCHVGYTGEIRERRFFFRPTIFFPNVFLFSFIFYFLHELNLNDGTFRYRSA